MKTNSGSRFTATNSAWLAWLRGAWLDILLGFSLGFSCASVLLGANLLTNVIGGVFTVVYVAANALNIWRMVRRKSDVPEIAP